MSRLNRCVLCERRIRESELGQRGWCWNCEDDYCPNCYQPFIDCDCTLESN